MTTAPASLSNTQEHHQNLLRVWQSRHRSTRKVGQIGLYIFLLGKGCYDNLAYLRQLPRLLYSCQAQQQTARKKDSANANKKIVSYDSIRSERTPCTIPNSTTAITIANRTVAMLTTPVAANSDTGPVNVRATPVVNKLAISAVTKWVAPMFGRRGYSMGHRDGYSDGRYDKSRNTKRRVREAYQQGAYKMNHFHHKTPGYYEQDVRYSHAPPLDYKHKPEPQPKQPRISYRYPPGAPVGGSSKDTPI